MTPPPEQLAAAEALTHARVIELTAAPIVHALIHQRDEARRFANRWIRAACYATTDTEAGGNMHAFDPMSPEAFAESRRHCLDTHIVECNAAREQARVTREALRELVLCKELKDAIGDVTDPDDRDRMHREYSVRKDNAWTKAREALRATGETGEKGAADVTH